MIFPIDFVLSIFSFGRGDILAYSHCAPNPNLVWFIILYRLYTFRGFGCLLVYDRMIFSLFLLLLCLDHITINSPFDSAVFLLPFWFIIKSGNPFWVLGYLLVYCLFSVSDKIAASTSTITNLISSLPDFFMEKFYIGQHATNNLEMIFH